ncbi:hypothetical protein [Phaeovulum sp.]|uniref:hypothetical protein n=1 Tax=Phaeovulum sp. TaxID=2934796 RepID=UPI003566AE4C
MDRKTRSAHSLFAPYITGEIHPARHAAAQRIVGNWCVRSGEFASLSWNDAQIADAIDDDFSRDTGFTAMLNRVLALRDGRGPLPA